MSKISQELLNPEFKNLVQSLGMSSCIVYLRIDNLRLIIPFIYPFFSLSDKYFHHISSVCIRVKHFKFYMHVQNRLPAIISTASRKKVMMAFFVNARHPC